jgi:hypothetical protein
MSSKKEPDTAPVWDAIRHFWCLCTNNKQNVCLNLGRSEAIRIMSNPFFGANQHLLALKWCVKAHRIQVPRWLLMRISDELGASLVSCRMATRTVWSIGFGGGEHAI